MSLRNTQVENRFLGQFKTDEAGLLATVHDALLGADDGELYVEFDETESLVLRDGKIESPCFSPMQGFGLRRVKGTQTGYMKSDVFDLGILRSLGKDMQTIFSNDGTYIPAMTTPQTALYIQSTPLTRDLKERIDLLKAIDAYVRRDQRVKAATVSLVGRNCEVMIARPERLVSEIRPIVRLNMEAIVTNGKDSVSVNFGFGGRKRYDDLFDPAVWQKHADKMLADATALLSAKPCPAGQMPVVLASGWAGVILHEAFGHSLEADGVWQQTSTFKDSMGQQIASPLVTVVDNGTIPNRRGSLSFDDEGTPTQRTVLVENGILKTFMHDRISARILGANLTGNGRRDGYRCRPIPRMTNTFMENGASDPKDIIAQTEHGLYAEVLGGGQVDTASGKFVFEVKLSWLIENGKITSPIKGATLTGTGGKALLAVDMVGNDREIDPGIGTCGKNGQSVPVGVGQPTFRIKAGGLTVGGTEVSG